MTSVAGVGGFYDVGALRQVAINLFYGWGYNFYRKENQLRADDQLVRAKAAELLNEANDVILAAERDYRRRYFKPPSRENPYPNAQAIAGAQSLERLAQDVGALKTYIGTLPVPEGDRMSERYRREEATLAALIACDEQLIGQSELLRAALAGQDAAWILENQAVVRTGLTALRATLLKRAAALTIRE
jgi:hypothetical protein